MDNLDALVARLRAGKLVFFGGLSDRLHPTEAAWKPPLPNNTGDLLDRLKGVDGRQVH